VICGIHDSNASLLPHVLANKPPFAVVSTGTWVISMAVGGRAFSLDPARDTLVNVNALGDPVPSARFMGGREYEMLGGAALVQPSDEDVASVLTGFKAILPSIVNGSGPFPDRAMQWTGSPAAAGERSVAASFYLALMTTTCLNLIGAAGDTIVEGPFASNELFLDMLAAATGRAVVAQTAQATGTSIGAAMLFQSSQIPYAAAPRRVHADADWIRYAMRWRSALTA
jgi:sugar (pentulose or hexulose) kinase